MENIDATRNTICWRFLAPNRWTAKEERFIGPVYLAKKDAFRRAGEIDVVFNKDAYVIAVDQLVENDTRRVSPTMQRALVTKLLARHLKLEEERAARA